MKYSEEEKKIIKNIENIIEMTFFPSNFGKGKVFINIDLDHIKVLLNLIEKQQKQIDNSIPKDIIKKIHENTDTKRKFTEEILKLLEE